MSSKFHKPELCKVTEIPFTSSSPELYLYFTHCEEASLPLFHERHNQSADFVTCKLAMVGILAENELLWYYTTVSYRLRSLHWLKSWLKLSSHPQCFKETPFPITGLYFHVWVSWVKLEESQKTHQRQTIEMEFYYNTPMSVVFENYWQGAKS